MLYHIADDTADSQISLPMCKLIDQTESILPIISDNKRICEFMNTVLSLKTT